MPTTSLGISYPTMKEVITAADFQATADDIDALLLALATKRALVRERLGAHVTGGANSVPNLTPTNMVYNTEVWDVGGISNLGVSNGWLTVPSGIWLVMGLVLASGWTTENCVRLEIVVDNVFVNSAHQMSRHNLTLSYVRVAGIVVAGSDGRTIGLRGFWDGTGGPASFFPKLTALRLRPL